MRTRLLSRILSVAVISAVAIVAPTLVVVPVMGDEPLLKAPIVNDLSERFRIRVAQATATPDATVAYTDDQAERGKKRFQSDCADCHGADLRGGLNGGPPLRGMAFEQTFAEGAPASALFMFMSTQMPPNDPGRYSPSEYADMMAFILKLNSFQSGAPLPSDVDALDHLTMNK